MEALPKIITKMLNKNSSGHDNISNSLLKKIANPLLHPLSLLFNKSMEEGIFPDLMKISEVIPLYKNKEKHIMNNYRPISLLPVTSKILEKIIYKRVYNFLVKNKILYLSQYGFREGHSTINAVTEFVGKIVQGFEKGECTLGIFLDLSKAFDTLDHQILLKKLDYYGIRGIAWNWFESYLSNRRLYVSYNGVHSDSISINYGVPQGSVLGPLLFLIYMNDIVTCLSKGSCINFADDTTIHISGKDIPLLYDSIKADISVLMDWFKANRLSLNLSKTFYVLFRPKNKHIPDSLPDLTFGTDIIKRVSSIKSLGIYVDEFLDWDEHVTQLCNKLSRSLYCMQSVKNILPKHCLRLLYFSYFHSHLNYGISLWGPMCKKMKLNRLIIQQKKTIRIVDKLRYNASTNNSFKKWKILKLDDMIKLDLCTLSHKFTFNNLPEPIKSLFTLTPIQHNYNTRSRHYPLISKHQTEIYNKSFLCQSPSNWFSISQNIRSIPKLQVFITAYKRHLINLYL